MKEEKDLFLSDIRSKLKYGDRTIIAKVVGCSPDLVKKVLTGHRGRKRGKGKQIIEVARKIIEIREMLKEIIS